MKCPKIDSIKLPLDCDELKQDNYSFSKNCVYRNGKIYGKITHHDIENKIINFTIVSCNRFLNGVKTSLKYN